MEDRLKTMTRNALKMANVVRHEDYHTLIDVSLLMTMPDCEFLKYRNVGKVTLEAIRWRLSMSLKRLSAGLSDGKTAGRRQETALHSIKTGWTVKCIAQPFILP